MGGGGNMLQAPSWYTQRWSRKCLQRCTCGGSKMLPLRLLCSLHLGRGFSTGVTEASTVQELLMVVGLGNYSMAGTRHSVGMAVLNQLARRLNVADRWRADRQSKADLVETQVDGMQLVLVKPRQFMNVNGESVAKAAGKFNVIPENIYLLHDELSKPFGKVSLKLGGSAKGHNGVRSCINYLQSDCMTRLLIGIGRPAGSSSVVGYVLEPFTRPEQETLPQVLELGVDTLLAHIRSRTSAGPAGSNGTIKNAESHSSKS
uniref:peptidyl-tRNA hydrolase n=1 Tax=Leptobrachium leishanense TaxID=445787 RepID=A0A8C5PFQ9_9ANUR